MLRYIYLLCFIISLEGVFCYKYIDDQPESRHKGLRVKRQAKDEAHRRIRKRQDSELDDRSLTQIDVSSFIQAADEFEDFEPVNYDGKRRKKPATSYEVSDFVPLVPLTPRTRRRPRAHRRAFQSDPNNAVTDPTSSYQQQLLISRHLVKNPKKKCASVSKMFPFFSHKKGDAAHKKDKEHKKSVKKLFRLGAGAKKGEQDKNIAAAVKNLDLHQKEKSKQEPASDEPRIEKRYAESICPKCKKKFLWQKKRRNANKLIHNSRQYFANLNNTNKNVGTSTNKYGNGNTKNVFDEDSDVRRKKRKIPRFGKVVRKK